MVGMQVSDLSGFAPVLTELTHLFDFKNSLYLISCRTAMRKNLLERGGKDI